jgi:hypothetical protein
MWAMKWQIGEEFVLTSSGLIQILNLLLFEYIYVSNVKFIERFRYKFFGWYISDVPTIVIRKHNQSGFRSPHGLELSPLWRRDGFLKCNADASLHCAQMRSFSHTFIRLRMNVHNWGFFSTSHQTVVHSPWAFVKLSYRWNSKLQLGFSVTLIFWRVAYELQVNGLRDFQTTSVRCSVYEVTYRVVRGSVLGWGTMLQTGRSRVHVPMRWIFFQLT